MFAHFSLLSLSLHMYHPLRILLLPTTLKSSLNSPTPTNKVSTKSNQAQDVLSAEHADPEVPP